MWVLRNLEDMGVREGIVWIRERRVRRTGRARDVRRIMRLWRFVVPVRYLDLGVLVGCWVRPVLTSSGLAP